MGNALAGLPANNKPRPNFRPFPNNVHFAAFGAPEAQSCVSCHNVGGNDGAGDLNHNIFQIGDGFNRASGVPRNPPPLLGSGLRQQIGIEMTAELQGQLAAGKAQANWGGVNVTVALSSKTRFFGSVVARPDGTVDFTNLSPGIDTDLVVKPFGWKGREAKLRRFIEGSFRVHFGMQTEPSANNACIAPNVNTFGNGPNCQDPDADGVTKEINDGQLSATSVYMALQEMPVRIPAATAAAQLRVNQGEALFNQVNCQGCHTQNMTINNPVHVERGDTTGGAGISFNLATAMHEPRPPLIDGKMTVEIWSDFRRHDMGPTDCDSKPFNQIGACFFMTPPLWGVRDTAPYLHDGRAATLLDAILLHGSGNATASINAFKALTADDQKKIVEFLGTLGRAEQVNAAECQAMHGFPLIPSQLLGTGGCQPDGCGLNGVWLGSGVSFRTLYLPSISATTGTSFAPLNEARIRITGFTKIGYGNNLSVDVQGQELLGKSGGQVVVNASNIAGAHLLLEHVNFSNQSDISYNLKINEVERSDFWIMPNGDRALLYDFSVTSSDGCNIALCQPGLDEDYTGSLIGRAVIFRGDLYTDYQVSLSPSNDTAFNIACVGTDLHKLHMLRHTSAASGDTSSPTVSERQALLRLLTADYCGTGHPFTENGTPIRFGSSNPDYQPTIESLYRLDNKVSSVEAMWTKDGASCITAPRLQSVTREMITSICPLPPPCESPPPGADMPTFMNELLLNRRAGDLVLYPGQSVRGYSSQPPVKIGNGWAGYTFAGTTDWDHDGHQDIIVRQDATGDLMLYPGQSVRGYSSQPPVKISNGWAGYTFAGTTDWDHDGHQDIIVRQDRNTLISGIAAP
jgi:hypothetical protein